MKVLIAEDDKNILRGIIEVLENEGYTTISAEDGEGALALFDRESPDFICLDIMMPKLNGYEVCKRIRQRNALVPIIFISAKSEEIDKVLGLELGADDYVMKPFGLRELMARVRAVSRRCLARHEKEGAPRSFRLGELEVVPSELRARRRDRMIELSLREVKILELFHSRPNEVLTRDDLYRVCWGIEHFANSRTLDQHVSKLRKKIELDPKAPDIIRTVHGAGYRWET
jgi:two-component system, OmpR family, alkaline phosphatase synthesis response regulator PhoP